MKYQVFSQKRMLLPILSTIIFLLPIFYSPLKAQDREEQQIAKFSCGSYKEDIPAVIGTTAFRSYALMQFQDNYFVPSGWTPLKRCKQIADKFSLNAKLKNLTYFVPGISKNLVVICGSKFSERSSNSCKDNDILFTLLPGQKADEVMEYLVAVASASSGLPPGKHSSFPIKIKQDKNGQYKIINVNTLLSISPEVKE